MLVRQIAVGACFLLAGCSGRQVTTPVPGLSYRAGTQVSATPPASATSTVTVTNTAGEVVTFEPAGGCVLLLKVYGNANRSGTPVWDQTAFASCTGAFQQITLGPGQSRDFQLVVRVSDILKGALPAGRYYFSAVLRLNGQEIVLPAGDADLPAQ